MNNGLQEFTILNMCTLTCILGSGFVDSSVFANYYCRVYSAVGLPWQQRWRHCLTVVYLSRISLERQEINFFFRLNTDLALSIVGYWVYSMDQKKIEETFYLIVFGLRPVCETDFVHGSCIY